MTRNAFTVVIGLAVIVGTAGPALAQSLTADVRTFAGHTYRLADVSLEMLYTIMPPRKDDAGPADTAPTTGARTPMLFGSASQIGQFLDKAPAPLQAQRQSETVTLRRDGTEVRLPLTELTSLAFKRTRITSTLPPHVAPQHYRHAVTAVLLDGSQLEGDYVNLGTTV